MILEDELSNLGIYFNGCFAWRNSKMPYRFFKSQRLIEEDEMPKNNDEIAYHINTKILNEKDCIIYKN